LVRPEGSGHAGPLIALALGERGLPSRILAAKYGAFLTYAPLEDGIPGAVALLQGHS